MIPSPIDISDIDEIRKFLIAINKDNLAKQKCLECWTLPIVPQTVKIIGIINRIINFIILWKFCLSFENLQ